MSRLITSLSLLLITILCGLIPTTNVTVLGNPPARVDRNIDTQPTIQSLNKMPLSFTKNMGQWDDRVLFRANAGGATMWFTKEGITYQFTRRIDSGNPNDRRGTLHVPAGTRSVPLQEGLDSRLRGNDMEKDSIDQLILTVKFIGANPNPEVIAEGQLEYKCNYFLGNDPSKWHTDVPNFEAITLKDIYPGIDLKYSSDGNGQAAYEFIAAPNADISQIKVAYDGAESTSLDSDGRLILKTKWGDMTAGINSPRFVGEGSAVRALLSGTAGFSQLANHPLGTAASSQSLAQANSGKLALYYSTFLGGGRGDSGGDIAIDGGGNAYVTGLTGSLDFPTLNPYQTDQVTTDVFVTKLSNYGNSLLYSTYLGGEGYDWGDAIAIDDSGNAYVTGMTTSSNFPTMNPFQTDQVGDDVFVTKLSSSGNSLVYSTYLGGGDEESGNGIAIDGSCDAYVTGYTYSSDFPTSNPYQIDQGGIDVFVTKFSSAGNDLIYSTYLGGGSADFGYCITIDGSNSAYVTGYTTSFNFPTSNPYQTNQGGIDLFVTKFSCTGNSLIYSTYLGGGSDDFGCGIAVDDSYNAFVTGYTDSDEFPTLDPYQQTLQGQFDVFVTKLSNSGNSLIYSTYIGGGDYDYGYSIAVNDSGNAFVTGYTDSDEFPTLDPYQQRLQGQFDVFVTKLSNSGNCLIYSTYLGGEGYDYGFEAKADHNGNLYVTGGTYSSDFPTSNPYQGSFQGGSCDAFVTKLTFTPNYSCGDVNTDEQVDLLDAVFLINYIFVGGPAPQQLSLADVNCSGSINIADVVVMINYIFRNGPAPCSECK
jgi:hypothetical protein